MCELVAVRPRRARAQSLWNARLALAVVERHAPMVDLPARLSAVFRGGVRRLRHDEPASSDIHGCGYPRDRRARARDLSFTRLDLSRHPRGGEHTVEHQPIGVTRLLDIFFDEAALVRANSGEHREGLVEVAHVFFTV